jgi:hypothetical protein
VQPLGGAGKVELFSYSEEAAKVTKLHTITTSSLFDLCEIQFSSDNLRLSCVKANDDAQSKMIKTPSASR